MTRIKIFGYLIYFIITFCLILNVEAQYIYSACNYFPGHPTQSIPINVKYPPTPLATNTVSIVCNTLQIPYVPIYRSNVPNAAVPMGERVILYNPQFLNQILAVAGYWAPASIIAHEVGHTYANDHLFGHQVPSWSKELRADFISGFALARLGAPLNLTTNAQFLMFNWGSPSHPDTPKRINAITQGWYAGIQSKK